MVSDPRSRIRRRLKSGVAVEASAFRIARNHIRANTGGGTHPHLERGVSRKPQRAPCGPRRKELVVQVVNWLSQVPTHGLWIAGAVVVAMQVVRWIAVSVIFFNRRPEEELKIVGTIRPTVEYRPVRTDNPDVTRALTNRNERPLGKAGKRPRRHPKLRASMRRRPTRTSALPTGSHPVPGRPATTRPPNARKAGRTAM